MVPLDVSRHVRYVFFSVGLDTIAGIYLLRYPEVVLVVLIPTSPLSKKNDVKTEVYKVPKDGIPYI